MKKILSLIVAFVVLATSATNAFAHVTVSPSEAETESYNTFVVSAPTHGEVAVTQIRLVIPEGLINVTPTVKTGWDVTVVSEGQHVMPDGTVMDNESMAMDSEEGEHEGHSSSQVTELIWTGGIVPGEQRDEFSFSAKTPENTTTLYWKAYQTFADGKVVSWELLPDEEYPKTEDGEDDVEHYGPASSTQIVASETSEEEEREAIVQSASQNTNNQAFAISIVAILLAAGVLGMQFMNKKK